MDPTTGNDDEEPQICTVFSSTPSSQSKTIFDTIQFSIPKKENVPSPYGGGSVKSPEPTEQEVGTTESLFSTRNVASPLDVDVSNVNPPIPQSTQALSPGVPPAAMFESLSMSYISTDPLSPTSGLEAPHPEVLTTVTAPQKEAELKTIDATAALPSSAEEQRGDITEAGLKLLSNEIEALSLGPTVAEAGVETPLPTANVLFSDAPEVPFPVSIESVKEPPPVHIPPQEVIPAPLQGSPIDEFSKATYSPIDVAYDAWIPSDQTRQVLMSISNAVTAGTYFPDKAHMTSPGIIYKDDLVDKVAVNMSRIFGEVEANKRQILTADSVTQDDNGIRELIKLGCYRSAINLTKRILTLYGQGPGKLGLFSKHTPHSLQLWMTRIALLVRIREFKIAESELESFKEFQNPDMFYEYYQGLYGDARKGSMVPFHFRLLAAEVPQYSSKDHNKSVNLLNQLLLTVQQIIQNIENGICEDGSSTPLSLERKDASLQIWKKREIRVHSSLSNAFMVAKDFPNALRTLSTLREKDTERAPQLTSAIGRLFLQYGDLPTAQKYFKDAASMRSSGTEVDRVENLIDTSLYFIAQGTYTDAFGLLKEALAIQPDNFMITNNMAVCLLYMGKVKESLALMEATVKNNTPQLLQENVILNLSTIYELENSDGVKKNALLKLISEYKGDGINLASLKMPNLI